VRTYHKDQKEKVMSLISTHDWDGLAHTLQGLSNMELRRMERVMREEVLTQLPNDLFWETLLHIIKYKRAAFITSVVAAEHLIKDHTINFNTVNTQKLYEHLETNHPVSLVKLCNMVMPMLQTEQQAIDLFTTFHIVDEVTRLGILLKTDTPLSYYLIFKTLKLIEDKAIARKCCMALIKRQDDRAFNAVCLTKAYFGLDDLPGRFSLKIEQYELSHIDRNYETFVHVLEGKRPKIN
jgi:hypothetical protein